MKIENEVYEVDIGGSPLPKGMPLAVQDLSYAVVSSTNKKVKVNLLKNVTCAFAPGQMAALMGSSGSGKTTLLDILAGRKTTGEITGSVLYSAQKASTNFLRRYTGYVEQFDTMLETLTVKEMLMYTAELKLPHTESYAEKEAAVDYFIQRLALTGCQHTKIGNATMIKGISGGQAKRTSIAMAMVTRPRVLFLDEPTSGLDSFTSNEAMLLVKQLALSEGVTIVATIHSPSPFTFQLFDSLVMLLSGEVVYFGPNDESMLDYFKGGCGIVPKTSMTDAVNIYNPAEFLTDLIVGAKQREMGHEYAEAYRNSAIKRRMDAVVQSMQHLDSLRVSPEVKKLMETKRATATPFWWGLKTIIKYRTSLNYKNPDFLGPRISDKIIFSVLIMALYWDIGSDFEESNMNNINAMLFMWTVLPAFGAASYVPSIVLERPLFVRERNDGLYRTATYLVAKIIDELILAIVASLIFSSIVYFPMNLKGHFVYFWLIYMEVLSIGIMLAYFVASLSPNMDVANTDASVTEVQVLHHHKRTLKTADGFWHATLPAYVVTLLFFAGLLMRYVDMPVYLAWYSRIDFMRYSWGGLMVNQYGDSDPEYANSTVLKIFGLTEVKVEECLGYLLLFFVGFFCLTLLTLTYKKYGSR